MTKSSGSPHQGDSRVKMGNTLKKKTLHILPSTSGRSFSAPCESSPRTGKVLMANFCLLVTRKASYFSFPRSIFAPV